MAEIKQERKQREAWPWLLAAVLLLVIVFAVLAFTGRDDDADLVTTDTVASDTTWAATGTEPAAIAATVPQELETYTRTCSAAEETAQPDTLGREHEYATNCFELLAGAMSAVAAQRQADPNITTQLETVRQQAAQIRQSDATAATHSGSVRDAANAAAGALATMQQAFDRRNSEAQQAVERARQASGNIQQERQLLEQTDTLRTFFRESGDALTMIATGGTATQ